ncbi:MAG TPA: YisL family protein [Ureibacillus sp.]|nr:YisL family protein [Ureibacillus sp.]
MGLLTNSTHLHITTWVIAIILFLVAALVTNSKAVHMVLRLFYILIIITGGALFYKTMDYGMGMQYGIKLLLGILTIGMMEMVLVRKSKGKPTTMFWILFAVFLFATLFFGFKLPMGAKLF